MDLPAYQHRFKTAVVDRDPDGVLTVRLHSKGETLWWGGLPHRELAELFGAIESVLEPYLEKGGQGDRRPGTLPVSVGLHMVPTRLPADPDPVDPVDLPGPADAGGPARAGES